MKKVTYLLFVVFVCSSIVTTGCGNKSVNEKEDSEITEKLTVFGGSVGGVWSIFTEGVSESVRREYPGTHINAVPGTVAGNPIAVDLGKAEFAISESLTAFFAYEGTAPFDEEHKNIRAVAAVLPENVFQLVAPKSVAFNSIDDVVNNKFGIRYSAGEKGALGDIVTKAIFEAHDVTYSDIEANNGEINYLSGGKTFELMGDGRIDGLGKMVPIPAGDIIEASATIDMKFIPIGENAITHLVDTYAMTPFTIKAGSYDFQSEDYETVNTPTILITNANMSDEVVYQVTASIYNQLDYLFDVHKGFKAVNDETIVDVGKVPLHPGAEKFYKEKGLLP